MRKTRERGLILLVVLWSVAAMTAIVVALSSYAQKNISLAAVEADRLRTELALQSGLEAGKAAILATPEEQRVFLNGEQRRITFDDGTIIEIELQDVAGLADLNRAPLAVLNLLAAGLEPQNADAAAIVESVVQIRTAEARPASDAARQQSRQATKPDDANDRPEKPKPAVFFSFGQLAGLRGASRQGLVDVADEASLYGADGKVNPLAAPDSVLAAIPGLSPEDKSAIKLAQVRKRRDDPSLQRALTRFGDFLAVREAKIFRIRATIVQGTRIIRGQKLEATVILEPEQDVPFQTLALSW